MKLKIKNILCLSLIFSFLSFSFLNACSSDSSTISYTSSSTKKKKTSSSKNDDSSINSSEISSLSSSSIEEFKDDEDFTEVDDGSFKDINADYILRAVSDFHDIQLTDCTLTVGLNFSSDAYIISAISGDPTTLDIPASYNSLPIIGATSSFSSLPEDDDAPLAGLTNLVSVTIPDSFTTISCNMFVNCTSLSEVTLPSTIKGIGDFAFYNCTSLKEINLPSSLESIRGCAFKGSGLESITIPDSVNNLADRNYTAYNEGAIFEDCLSLTSVTFPSYYSSLPKYCFRNCSSLTSFTINDNVTEIPDSCFESCLSLTDVSIPNKLISINKYAFAFCSALNSIDLNENLEVIDEYSFYECTNLETLTIPSTVNRIGIMAFYDTIFGTLEEDSDYLIKNGWIIAISDNIYSSATITLPPLIKGMIDALFAQDKFLYTITLPNTVKYISQNCFYDCQNLFSINSPSSLLIIRQSAFLGDNKLTSFSLNEGLETIENNAFSNSGLTKVNIPDSLISLDYSFTNCSKLEEIDIHDDYLPIGFNLSFIGCENITRINIDSTNDVLVLKDMSIYDDSEETFYTYLGKTTQLTEFIFDNDVLYIDDYALARIRISIGITLPTSLISIGEGALYPCSKNQDIVLPTTIQNISSLAFGPNISTEVKKVTYNGTLEDYLKIDFGKNHNLLYGRELYLNDVKLEKLDIDGRYSNIRNIPNYIFQYYSYFTEVKLDYFIQIGKYAFQNATISGRLYVNAKKISYYALYATSKEIVIGKRLQAVGTEFFPTFHNRINNIKTCFEGSKADWYRIVENKLLNYDYPIYFYSETEKGSEYYHYDSNNQIVTNEDLNP